MSKKSEKKRPVGRPTKYKPEYCEEIIKFFNQPLYIYVDVEKMSASGAVKIVKERIPNDVPLFERFAFSISVCHDTLIEWTNVHKDFSEAYRVCKGLQKTFIQTHGTNGNYNANFTKFFAINNLGMTDKTEIRTENEHKVEGYGLAFDLTTNPEDL